MEARYIDPQNIRNAAHKLRATGKDRHIKKTDWCWVELKDLLEEKILLTLSDKFKRKLKQQNIGKFLKSLLESKVEVTEEDSNAESDTE